MANKCSDFNMCFQHLVPDVRHPQARIILVAHAPALPLLAIVHGVYLQPTERRKGHCSLSLVGVSHEHEVIRQPVARPLCQTGGQIWRFVVFQWTAVRWPLVVLSQGARREEVQARCGVMRPLQLICTQCAIVGWGLRDERLQKKFSVSKVYDDDERKYQARCGKPGTHEIIAHLEHPWSWSEGSVLWKRLAMMKRRQLKTWRALMCN